MSEFLLNEIHGLSHDGLVVITVQRWQPNVLIVFRNGERASRKTASVPKVNAEYTRAAAALIPTRLTDFDARHRLAELTGTTDYTCMSRVCGAQLPVGGYRCASCGAFPARQAAGIASAATRRPEIYIRMDP